MIYHILRLKKVGGKNFSMKKLLSLIFVSLLISGNTYSKNHLPNLECYFIDDGKKEGPYFFNLNDYKNITITDKEYDAVWIVDKDYQNQQSFSLNVKRNTGASEFWIMPIKKKDASLAEMMEGDPQIFLGECSKAKNKKL